MEFAKQSEMTFGAVLNLENGRLPVKWVAIAMEPG